MAIPQLRYVLGRRKPQQDGKQITSFAHMRPDTRLLSLLMVYFTVFVDFLGVGLLIPTIPFLVGVSHHRDSFSKDDMGGLEPGAASSLILLSFNGAQLISTLVFGPMSDRFGRKPLLLSSMMGGAIGYVCTGVAIFFDSFWLLLAARALTGLFGGTRPVAIAYIADAAQPGQRAKLLGFLALAVTFAMQFGPVLGGSLGQLELQLPCYVAGCVSFVGFFMVSSFVQETRVASVAATPGSTGASAQDQNKGDYMAFFLTITISFYSGLWVMGHVLNMSLLTPLKFDFDPNQVGLAALGDGLAILVANPLYMYMIRHFRLPTVAMIGWVLATAPVVCPYVEVAPLFVFRYTGGFGISLTIPAVTAIVGSIAPAPKRGAWSGLVIAGQSLGRTISPLVMGLTFDVDYHIPFWICFGVAVAGFLTTLILIPRVPREGSHSAPTTPKQQQAAAIDGEELSVVSSSGEPPLSRRVSELLSIKAEALVEQLRERQQLMHRRLDSIKAGEPDPLAYPPATEEQRTQTKQELGDWLADTLEARGYTAWVHHMDGLRLMLSNSFPPIRTEPDLDKLMDLIAVLEGHILMAEKKEELFNGCEDLVHAMP